MGRLVRREAEASASARRTFSALSTPGTCSDHRPVRGGHADCRSAPHPQELDRLPHRRHVATVNLDELGGQQRLIDQAQVPLPRVANPANRLKRLGPLISRHPPDLLPGGVMK